MTDLRPLPPLGDVRDYANMQPALMQVRQATRQDLCKVLDLYQHLVPGDDRPAIEVAVDILDRVMSYEGSAIL
jgi:hypothetical protein